MAYKDPEKRREYRPSTASATGRSYEKPRARAPARVPQKLIFQTNS